MPTTNNARLDLPLASKHRAHEPAQPTPPRRRRLIAYAVLALVLLSALHQPLLHGCRRASDHVCRRVLTVEQRARRILAQNPLIDGHVDFAATLRTSYGNRIDNPEWARAFENGTMSGQVDLARLKRGRSGGAFWSVFAPCPAKALDFSDANLAASLHFTLDQIDVTARALAAYPDSFAMGLDSSGVDDAFRAGKLVSPFGIEGLHQIANSAAALRRFHRLGVRYATLTHNCHNNFADAALLERPIRKAKPHWGGVSPRGRKLLHEMNRIGLIVDLAHVSHDTMLHVLGGHHGWQGSKAPVIFSHSSVWSICPHPRNVKDDILQLVKERNSLVMINVYPGFISCLDVGNRNGLPDTDMEHADLDQVVKHITYVGNLIGYDHVGIGTDFDGIDKLPRGFEDAAKYPDLVAALLRAGVSDSDVAKVVGRNLIRVWRDVDAVSAGMRAEGAPVLEDDRKPQGREAPNVHR